MPPNGPGAKPPAHLATEAETPVTPILPPPTHRCEPRFWEGPSAMAAAQGEECEKSGELEKNGSGFRGKIQ